MLSLDRQTLDLGYGILAVVTNPVLSGSICQPGKILPADFIGMAIDPANFSTIKLGNKIELPAFEGSRPANHYEIPLVGFGSPAISVSHSVPRIGRVWQRDLEINTPVIKLG